MKCSVIRDIFNGDRGNIQAMRMPKEYRKYIAQLTEAYEKLEPVLSSEQLKMHNKFVRALEMNQSEEIDFYFVEGFKLGLLIGMECSGEEV